MTHPLCAVKYSSDYLYNRADKLTQIYTRSLEENTLVFVVSKAIPYFTDWVDWSPRKLIIIGSYYSLAYTLDNTFKIAEPYFEDVHCDMTVVGNSTQSDVVAEYFGL